MSQSRVQVKMNGEQKVKGQLLPVLLNYCRFFSCFCFSLWNKLSNGEQKVKGQLLPVLLNYCMFYVTSPGRYKIVFHFGSFNIVIYLLLLSSKLFTLKDYYAERIVTPPQVSRVSSRSKKPLEKYTPSYMPRKQGKRRSKRKKLSEVITPKHLK